MHLKLRPSFFNEIAYFVLFFRVAGISYFARNPIHSVVLTIYCVLNISAIILIFISALFINQVVQENSLSSLVGGLVFIALCIAHLIIIIQSFATRNKQLGVCDKFSEIDSMFENKLNMTVNYSDMKRKSFLKLLISIIIVTVLPVAVILNNYFTGDPIGYYAHCLYSTIVIRLRCLQNMLYVDMVSERLKLVNEKLEEIIKSNREDTTMVMFIDKYYDYGRKPGFNQILSLKIIYGKIWDIMNLINDCYGWSLLAISTQYFIDFTSNGYWLFLSLENLLSRAFMITCILNIIPCVFIMTLLAYSCYCCSQNVNI